MYWKGGPGTSDLLDPLCIRPCRSLEKHVYECSRGNNIHVVCAMYIVSVWNVQFAHRYIQHTYIIRPMCCPTHVHVLTASVYEYVK